MGHGIFPNYGPNYIKTVAALISKAEAKQVFYTSKKEKKAQLLKERAEEDNNVKKRNKR